MTTSNEPKEAQATELSGKYLTFFLGEEEYGVPILEVQEIVRAPDTTPMPNMPSHVSGVINLRGKIVPIFDLRRRFDLPDAEYSDKTCIIVVNVHGRTSGIIVDRVSEVIDIQEEIIEPAATLASDVSTNFLLGIANCEDRLKILLAMDNVLPNTELAAPSS